MKKLLMKNKYLLLILILAIIARFLFFPGNIYFGFDQARDAFLSQEILKGDLQIVGPTTSLPPLRHGVAYYYLIAPIYLIGQGSPEVLSVFMRLLNAIGVFLTFYITWVLFKKQSIALIAAFFYAISFEQTQFAMYMGNPSPASLSVPAMFLGLALVIFSKKSWGLIVALFALGLSIQFQFALFYLIVPAIFILAIFYKSFLRLPIKTYLLSAAALILSVSTFLLAEIKFGFQSLKFLLNYSNPSADKSVEVIVGSYLTTLETIGRLNIYSEATIGLLILLLLLIIYIYLLVKRKDNRPQLIFLGIWFFSLFASYVFGGGRKSGEQLYYTNIGVSVSLLIFIAYIINVVYKRYRYLGISVVILIAVANFYHILKFNPLGTITAINVQQGMMLQDQKKILDIIYQDAKGEEFAAKALTMPFLVNTTWAYLYEWYGKKEYGYLPTWGDKNAIGYPGNLKVVDAQDSLPARRYVVLEPVRGLPEHIIKDYLRIEGYFTDIEWEKEIGSFKVQKRVKKSD